jgi:hypothetical protein
VLFLQTAFEARSAYQCCHSTFQQGRTWFILVAQADSKEHTQSHTSLELARGLCRQPYAKHANVRTIGGGEYAGNGYYNQPSRNRGNDFASPPSRNKYGPRMYSEPTVGRSSQVGHPYSTPGYGQTRDTVNTGGSNGSASDQWHNSTDPSSDNSSIERIKAEGHGEYGYPTPPQREPIAEDGHYTYNNNGGGYNPSYMGSGPNASSGASNGHNYNHSNGGQSYNNGPPAPPPKAVMGGPVQAPPAAAGAPRQLIKLSAQANQPSRPEAPEKRKSWLKRRFSKN